MPKELKQDWSGHVSFNAQEAAFVASIETKRVWTEKQRALGMLRKQDRNPILDMKTPRYNAPKIWNYNPGLQPEHLKAKEKWVYETHDGTIMGKFNSQQAAYAQQQKWQDDCDRRVKVFDESQRQQKDNLKVAPKSVSLGEFSSTSARSTSRSSPREVIMGGNSIEVGGKEIAKDNKHTGRMSTQRTDISALTERSDFEHEMTKDNKLTTLAMRTLANSNPQVNAKHRALRAANYVSSLRKPLLPPTYRSTGGRASFKPAGTIKKDYGVNPKEKMEKHYRRISIQEEYVDTARLKSNLGQLVEALEATDKQLALQQLKVTLNSKPKSYELPTKERK